MSSDVSSIGSTFLALVYIAGLVISKGFWNTLIAAIVFPYSWYIAVEHFLKLLGWM
jgi:uncharacterized membrane protein